jgi:hypothetical protein
MTLRITDDFILRRGARQLAVSIGPVTTKLTIDETRKAAEAFNMMTVLMYNGQEAALPKAA